MKTLKNIFFLLALLILSIPSVNAQDFKGNWDGKLIVTVNGEETNLDFRMSINTDALGNCEGVSRLLIPVNGVYYYGQFSFKGTYKGEELTFKDTKLLESTSPDSDFYWCIKSGTLYFYNNTLTGSVTGYSPMGDCMPAKARLDYHSALEYK